MKNLAVFLFIVALSTCSGFAPALAKEPSLQPPPGSIEEPERSALKKQYEEVRALKESLNAQIEQMNAHCERVLKDSPEASQCIAEDSDISRQKREYADMKADYVRELANAKDKGKAFSKGTLAKSAGSGEFYLETPEGKRISGKEAMNIPLNAEMKVVTGGDGEVTLTFEDGTRVRLHPNSQFTFSTKDKAKSYAEIYKGMVYWVERASRRRFEVRTPCAIVGVRGTDFEVSVNEDKSGYIKLFSGALDYTPKSGEKMISLAGRQVLQFAADGSVTGPTPLEAGDKPHE